MTQEILPFFKSMFQFPSFGSGIFSVWHRNYTYFKYTIWVSVMWLVVEPLLYLFAFGYGLGQYVNPVGGQSYVEFFFPGLMVGSAMLVCFFEGTYGCFTKLVKQGTFRTVLQTPVVAEEIAVGEIIWATSKGMTSGLVIGLIGISQGYFTLSEVASMSGVVLLVCFMTSSMAVFLTTVAKSYDWFMFAQTGFFMPMYLFSGTYFPLESMPYQMQQVVWCLPLTHAVSAMRGILAGNISQLFAINIGVIIVLCFFCFNVAVARFRRRLVD